MKKLNWIIWIITYIHNKPLETINLRLHATWNELKRNAIEIGAKSIEILFVIMALKKNFEKTLFHFLCLGINQIDYNLELSSKKMTYRT